MVGNEFRERLLMCPSLEQIDNARMNFFSLAFGNRLMGQTLQKSMAEFINRIGLLAPRLQDFGRHQGFQRLADRFFILVQNGCEKLRRERTPYASCGLNNPSSTAHSVQALRYVFGQAEGKVSASQRSNSLRTLVDEREHQLFRKQGYAV